jgi:sugar phosphate isomerase/epimerase
MRVGTQQETWDINLSFMRELLATAKQYGITICLENMPFCEFSLSKPTDILRFVREINDDNFKICLDTGHITVFEDLLPGDSVRSLGKEIRTLHVHDNKEHIDLHMMPYFGNIDWKDFANALKEIEFNGVFSLETLPPVKLDNDMFEKSCIMLAESAKRITANL